MAKKVNFDKKMINKIEMEKQEMEEYKKPQFELDIRPTTEIVNFDDPIDVKIEQIETTEERKFKARIYGKSVNNGLVNVLRDTIYSEIPTYGFYSEDVEYLDSSCTSYGMIQAIAQIPTIPIPLLDEYNKFDFIDYSLYLSTPESMQRFANHIPNVPVEIVESGNVMITRLDLGPNTFKDKKKDNIKKVVEIYGEIIKKNDTNKNIPVCSTDIQLYIDGKPNDAYQKFAKMYDKIDLFLFTLKPTEYVHIKMKASLGCCKLRYGTYDMTTSVTAVETKKGVKSNDDYTLDFKTLGQLESKEIFKRACTISKLTYIQLKKYVSSLDVKTDMERVEIYGKRHSIGKAIKIYLQRHPDIDSCTVDPNEKRKIVINTKLNEKSKNTLRNLYLQCLQFLVEIYAYLENWAAELK